MTRRSGLQNDVISLYRRALRIVRTKPVTSQARFRTLIRWSFRGPETERVTSKDIAAIEHLIRKRNKNIELWENTAIKDVVCGVRMRSWEEGRRWVQPDKSIKRRDQEEDS